MADEGVELAWKYTKAMSSQPFYDVQPTWVPLPLGFLQASEGSCSAESPPATVALALRILSTSSGYGDFWSNGVADPHFDAASYPTSAVSPL